MLLNYMINPLKINYLKIVFNNIVGFGCIHHKFLLNYIKGNFEYYLYIYYHNYFKCKVLLDLLDHQLVICKIDYKLGNLKLQW